MMRTAISFLISFLCLFSITAPSYAVATLILSAAYLATVEGMIVAFVIRFAASQILNKIFASKPPKPKDNGVRQQVPPASTNSLPVVYGDAYLGGVFVDAVLSKDQTIMYYTMAVSCISPNGQFSFDQTKMYYGDRLITFDGTDGAKVVSLTDGNGNVDTKIDGNLWIYLYTSDEAGNVTAQTSNPSMPWDIMGVSNTNVETALAWPTTGRRMNGLAFALVTLLYSRDDDTTQLQPITFKASQYLFSEGVAKPGSVWYDYMTNTKYGAAMDASLVDTVTGTALNAYSDGLIAYTDSSGNPATQARYRINGVLDTGENCLANVNRILDACDSWMSYDCPTGKWSVVINKEETSSFAFNDSNLVGNISVGATDINSTINQIEVRFPSKLNKDIPDYVFLETPSALLYDNEPVNKASLNYDLVNDNVQAAYIANRALEQARLDLIVTVRTTYEGIQINAGDVVTVTNSAYGWSSKPFRVMKVNEVSLPDGNLGAELQLNEYDSQVYDDKDITEFVAPGESLIPAPQYFSPLSAPTVTASYPSASVPTFDVQVTTPTTGRVTYGNLFYTTTASPTATDYKQLSTAQTGNGQAYPNSTAYLFAAQSLPAGTYYFAFQVGNELAFSAISPLSTAFTWAPVGQLGPTGPTGATGTEGPTGPAGADGDTGPRNAQVYFFYNSPQSSTPTAPTTSQVSYNFSTQTPSISASGWSTTFNPGSLGTVSGDNKYWAVKVVFQENTFGGSYSETISSVFTWQNMDGLVTFTNLSSGEDENGNNTSYIDGGTITTNTLNVSTIRSNTTGTYNGGTFGLGIGTTVGGFSTIGGFVQSTSTRFGVIATNSTSSGNGVGAACRATTNSGAAVAGVGAANSSYSTWKTLGVLGNGVSGGEFVNWGAGTSTGSPTAEIKLAYYVGGVSYAFYIQSGSAYPFTAGHDGMQLLTESAPEVGDLMVDVSLIAAPNVNDCITQMSVSTSANQKGVIGALAALPGNDFVPASLGKTTKVEGQIQESFVLKPEYANIYDTYRALSVNAIGEGMINVCGQNGDIEIGDFIVASDVPGKGMKQSDDVFHSYTVAKARENVTFASPSEVKMIACIYMAG